MIIWPIQVSQYTTPKTVERHAEDEREQDGVKDQAVSDGFALFRRQLRFERGGLTLIEGCGIVADVTVINEQHNALHRRDLLAIEHGVVEQIDAGDGDIAGHQTDHHGQRKPAGNVPAQRLHVGPGAQEQLDDLPRRQRWGWCRHAAISLTDDSAHGFSLFT